MKFTDLRPIQQFAILADMINEPSDDSLPSEKYYSVPETDYKLDLVDIKTTNTVYFTVQCDNSKDYMLYVSGTDNPNIVEMNFSLSKDIDDNTVLDRFGLLGGLTINGDIEEGLKKVHQIITSLSKLDFVSGEIALSIIQKCLDALPIARSLPEAVYNVVHIDEEAARLVDTIRENLSTTLERPEYEIKPDVINIFNYFMGHIVSGPHNEEQRTITFRYGQYSGDTIVVNSNTLNDEDAPFGATLAAVKVNREDSVDSVINALRTRTLESLKDVKDSESYMKLAEVYFELLDASKAGIESELIPF